MRFVFLIILCMIQSVIAQTQSITGSAAQEDLRFLRANMEKYHPGLQEYNPEFSRQADSLINTIGADSMTLFAYFGLVTQLIAKGNEGHYSIGNWADTVHSGFMRNAYKYLPMNLRVLNGELYVWDCFAEGVPLKRGDRILAFNGEETSQLLQSMYRFISSDGHIRTNMEYRLSAGFSWMYYLYIGRPEGFTIEYRAKENGKQDVVRVPALTRQQMVENAQKMREAAARQTVENPSGEQAVYEINYRNKTAFLTLRSFDRSMVEQNKIKAAKLYKTIFSDLAARQVEHLVVDLRDNTGGRNEFAYEMLPYILKKPVKGVFKTSYSWEGKAKTYKIPAKNKRAFSGKIYVLVNRNTFSAGASLARYLREYGGAITIGEEAGGRYEGFVAGSEQTVFLPNTNIRIGIPRYNFKFGDSTIQQTRNRGLIPEHVVSYSIEDLIENRNLALEMVETLIPNR